jgi:hypothetical protein
MPITARHFHWHGQQHPLSARPEGELFPWPPTQQREPAPYPAVFHILVVVPGMCLCTRPATAPTPLDTYIIHARVSHSLPVEMLMDPPALTASHYPPTSHPTHASYIFAARTRSYPTGH